jgi:DNA-binding IscR family transcriptional regulator
MTDGNGGVTATRRVRRATLGEIVREIEEREAEQNGVAFNSSI